MNVSTASTRWGALVLTVGIASVNAGKEVLDQLVKSLANEESLVGHINIDAQTRALGVDRLTIMSV